MTEIYRQALELLDELEHDSTEVYDLPTLVNLIARYGYNQALLKVIL